MEEALALVADVLRQLEQTAFHGAKKMPMQQYCALHRTVYGGPPWPGDDRTQFLQAVYEQYSSEAQAVAERSVARLTGQQHGERYAQALFGELAGVAYYARVSGNLFGKALGSFLQDSQLYRGRLEIAPLTFHKFGEALDRSVEILASGKLTAEERKITARVIELCRGSKLAADASLIGKAVEMCTSVTPIVHGSPNQLTSGRVASFDPVTGEHTIEYDEDTTEQIEHYDGTIETVVVLPRGTSERRNLSRVEWRLKALSITPSEFCQKVLRHRAAMLARRQAAVQTLLLCVGLKDDARFLRAECDEAPALRALARLAKAGPDAVMLLVLEKAFGGPIDFRREMAVMLDA